jgi:glycosyltransferase involved in cell wall biosynthesis
VILEAQASGLPVVAVAAGGPLSLVEDRVSGLLAAPAADALAECVVELASSPLLRRRLAAVALAEVRGRTWEAAMERLAEGYARALEGVHSASGSTPGASGSAPGPGPTPDASGATPGARRAA